MSSRSVLYIEYVIGVISGYISHSDCENVACMCVSFVTIHFRSVEMH